MHAVKKLDPHQLAGKVIDGHSHVGVSLSMFLSGCYPYCQSAQTLLDLMDANDVDCAITFPYGESAYFDIRKYLDTKRRVPRRPPLTPAPFIPENRLLCEEIYEKVPGAAGRILPSLCIDPGRRVREQVKEIERLIEEYPVYGFKVSGIFVQSSHLHLLRRGAAFMRLAEDLNLPVQFHSTAYAGDKYSHSSINLKVARAYPKVRFCMAHCLGFDKPHLDEANNLPNVWVDSAALKIQVEANDIIAPASRRFPTDYADYRTVLHGTYAKERAALDALSLTDRTRVANKNTCSFLFGD
jgi:predicted TIM-barrel fold metal-dependent hydrolase